MRFTDVSAAVLGSGITVTPATATLAPDAELVMQVTVSASSTGGSVLIVSNVAGNAGNAGNGGASGWL
jgi:hypothetical protein